MGVCEVEMILRFVNDMCEGTEEKGKIGAFCSLREGSADWSRMQRAKGGLYGMREKELCV